ncbi:MAG: MerC domain-containing protein [Pseudomonadota bacterium]
MRANTALSFDSAALGLSGLCLIHCLALPLMAAALPALASVAEAEWLHKAFVVAALPVSLVAMARGGGAVFTGLALVGLALLLAGAFAEPLHDYETALTVAGALILSAAHLWRWRRHSTAH